LWAARIRTQPVVVTPVNAYHKRRRPQQAGLAPSPDDVVQTMARTVADELTQPLTVLVLTLHLWKEGYYSAEPTEAVQEHLLRATTDLTQRIDRLRSAQRFLARSQAGITVLDLDRAQPGKESQE